MAWFYLSNHFSHFNIPFFGWYHQRHIFIQMRYGVLCAQGTETGNARAPVAKQGELVLPENHRNERHATGNQTCVYLEEPIDI